jgi:rubredoxin
MSAQDEFDEEPTFEAEPESWQPPARCPQCRGAQTRFIRMEYEASVYECEVCGIQFEAEE